MGRKVEEDDGDPFAGCRPMTQDEWNMKTPIERMYAELYRQDRALRAIKYTCEKPEVKNLLRDPILFAEGFSYISKTDAVGFRTWCNVAIYGFADITRDNLRHVAAQLCIPKYGSLSRDELMTAIVEYRQARSAMTEEDKEDEFRPGEDPEVDPINRNLFNRNYTR